jgi:flagellar biosynthesis/type III secretory pathway M-ring protein FliF/YscJ
MVSPESISEKAKAYKETKSKKGIWAWIVGGVLAIGLAVGIYLLQRKLAADQRALAELRTKAEQNKIKAAKDAHFANAQMNTNKRLQLQAEAVILNNRAEKEIARIEDLQKQNEKIIATIKSVDSWAELDNLNQAGRT